ncbi:phage terminase large subunit family protein [Halomarina pelagica]|uniref:phage terminase large subunit family protein n=1 Tax=Halomarina pelagica TaxID=2961599 RepID=UPI0020C5748D|nr:phage terminase large subunit family protein [Halomarina sp. BND7]
MSHVDLRRRSPGRRSRPKTTLFCPTCGHESTATADGDWVLVERTRDGERQLAYECPVCGTALSVHRVLQ